MEQLYLHYDVIKEMSVFKRQQALASLVIAYMHGTNNRKITGKFYSGKLLCEELEINKRTYRRTIKKLKEHGYIDTVNRNIVFTLKLTKLLQRNHFTVITLADLREGAGNYNWVLLWAYLLWKESNQKSDKNELGHPEMTVNWNHISEKLGLSQQQINRTRKTLVEMGRIKFTHVKGKLEEDSWVNRSKYVILGRMEGMFVPTNTVEPLKSGQELTFEPLVATVTKTTPQFAVNPPLPAAKSKVTATPRPKTAVTSETGGKWATYISKGAAKSYEDSQMTAVWVIQNKEPMVIEQYIAFHIKGLFMDLQDKKPFIVSTPTEFKLLNKQRDDIFYMQKSPKLAKRDRDAYNDECFFSIVREALFPEKYESSQKIDEMVKRDVLEVYQAMIEWVREGFKKHKESGLSMATYTSCFGYFFSERASKEKKRLDHIIQNGTANTERVIDFSDDNNRGF